MILEFTVDQNPRIFENEIPWFLGAYDHDHDSFCRIACNKCDCASSYAGHLRRHLEHAAERSHTNTTSVINWLFIFSCCLDRSDSLKMLLTVRSQINATNATLYSPSNVIWGHIWKHTVEKNQTTSVIKHIFKQVIWECIWKFTGQMQPMWLCTYQGRRFKESFENTTTPHCGENPFQHILIGICVVNTWFLKPFWKIT